MLTLLTSCQERRLGEFEQIDWWHFIRADDMSEAYRLSQFPAAPTGPGTLTLQTFTDGYTISDGQQTIELLHVEGLNHSDNMLVAYLPKDKILINADLYSPPPAGGCTPANCGLPNPAPAISATVQTKSQFTEYDYFQASGGNGFGVASNATDIAALRAS